MDIPNNINNKSRMLSAKTLFRLSRLKRRTSFRYDRAARLIQKSSSLNIISTNTYSPHNKKILPESEKYADLTLRKSDSVEQRELTSLNTK